VEREKIPMVPTRMRQLRSWYKTQKGAMFGVRYLDEDLHKEENIVWVKFKYLYHFYQKATLEVSTMSLWTM